MELTTTFHIFLFSICKRIWLKKLKKKGRQTASLDVAESFTFEEDFDENFIRTRKWCLFNRKFNSLGEDCRKVLQLLFNGSSGKAIAVAMGYTEEYTKRKKYKCKMRLAQMIRSDPEFEYLRTYPPSYSNDQPLFNRINNKMAFNEDIHETIEVYLDNRLTEDERQKFEQQMRDDHTLADEVALSREMPELLADACSHNNLPNVLQLPNQIKSIP